MSFTRVNPGGWAVLDNLTSAQMNALDIDHFNSLDKTTAGDTLSGVITMAATAAIAIINAGAVIESGVSGGIVSVSAGGIQANVANALQGTFAGSIQPTVAAGISSGVVGGITATAAGGIKAGVAGGITSGIISGIKAGVAAGIVGEVAGGISATIAGGIASNVDGGIALSGTTGDWITYTNTRSINRVVSLTHIGPAVSQSAGSIQYTAAGTFPSSWGSVAASNPTIAPINGGGPLSFQPQAINAGSVNAPSYYLPLEPYHGSTITGATVRFIPAVGHANLPTAFPAFGIWRQKSDGTGLVSLYSGGFVQYSTASLGTYNGGTVLTMTLTPDQNNLVDRTQYDYFLVLWDEAGTNAVVENNYMTVTLLESGIANSQPG